MELSNIPSPRNRRGTRELRAFFERNPAEELSIADMMAKTGLSESTIRNYIGWLIQDGIVVRESIYKLKRN